METFKHMARDFVFESSRSSRRDNFLRVFCTFYVLLSREKLDETRHDRMPSVLVPHASASHSVACMCFHERPPAQLILRRHSTISRTPQADNITS